MYLTYESTSGYPVSFDDFTYTHTTTRVLASNAYYPFGMLSGQSWVRPENPLNRNLYNAGNERNEITGYDETFYRLYDPALGRFMGIDPLADIDPGWSPYSYGRANPLMYNDPLGDQVMIIPEKLYNILVEYYKDKQEVSILPSGGGIVVPSGAWGVSYHSDGTREYFGKAGDVIGWANRNGYGDVIQAITKTKYYSYSNANTRDTGSTSVIKVNQIVGVKINLETPLPDVISPEGFEDQFSGGYHWWFDKQGEQLFNHWVNGGGAELILNSSEWEDYMLQRGELSSQIEKEIKSKRVKGNTQFSGSMHGQLDVPNLYRTGHQMLNGSNSREGDLQYSVNVEFLDNFGRSGRTAHFYVDLIWNDIMDANHQYRLDRIGERLFPGTNYTVRIYWRYYFTLHYE